MTGRVADRRPARADVLVVGPLSPTPGGIARVAESHIDALRRAGWSVQVVNTGQRVRRRPGRAGLSNMLSVASDALRVLVTTVNTRPGIVAVHSLASPTAPALRALALVAAARAGGAKAALHIHAYDLVDRVDGRRGLLCPILAATLRLVTVAVVLGEPDAERLRGLASNVAVRLLPNAIDTDVFHPTSSSVGAPVRAVVVGAVGRRKGIPELLATLEELPGLHLDIIGPVSTEPGDSGSECMRAVRAAESGGRVRYLGTLSAADVAARLRDASMFVLLSHAEGMPVALLEAMASGLPCVVTDVGTMARIVDDASCGVVVDSGDAGAVTRALRHLASSGDARAQAGSRARQHALRHHSTVRLDGELASVYGLSPASIIRPSTFAPPLDSA
jgi:glycosyltransferase involved in cell wall biosynthesis